MLEYVKERDLATILNCAYEHDGIGYKQYILEVINLPSNRLLVQYIDGKMKGWVGFHNSPDGEWDHLYATSVDNTHTIDMWREIRKIVKGRQRPLVSGITANFDTMNRMATLYGGKLVGEYKTLVFP